MLNRFTRISGKMMVGFLVVLLMAGAAFPVFAEDNGPIGGGGASVSPRMTFPDVGVGHWAEKSIAKLTLLDIIHGDDKGNFNPKNSITKEQAVVMAVNMMGLQDQLSAYTDVVLGLEVTAYAKAYVALAMEKGLISRNEELSAMVKEKRTSSWGTTPASREWVAKITMRAIGKDSDAVAAVGEATVFTDDAKISPEYRGYVKEASDLKIISGLPDGSFNPGGIVTRQEMAVLFANAEKFVSRRSSLISSGVALDVSSYSIRIQSESGAVQEFPLAPNAMIYRGDSNNQILLTEVKQYFKVDAIQANGTVYYLEITDDQIQYQSVSGTLESISLANTQITLNVNGTSQVYDYATNVVVVDRNGNGSSLSALTAGSEVEVLLNAYESSNKAVQIHVKAESAKETVTGTVASFNAAERSVNVTDSTGSTRTFIIPEGLPIVSGYQSLSVSDLHPGDLVTVQTTDETVTAFEINQPSVTTVAGKFSFIKDNVIFIKEHSDALPVAYELTANPAVVIQGMESASVGDLQEGDAVTIELNTDNKAQKIRVNDRNVDVGLGYTIKFVDTKGPYFLLQPKDASQKPAIFNVTDKTVFNYYEIPITMENLDNYFSTGKKVDITYSGDRLLSMRLTLHYTGNIVSLNALSKTITLNTDEFGQIVFGYTYAPTVDVLGKSPASLSDLSAGDRVQLTLDANQDKVAQIQLDQSLLFKVSSKSYYTLVVKDLAGNEYSFNNLSSVPVTKSDNQPASTADFDLNDEIILHLAGKSLNSIMIPQSYTGTVTSVDTLNAKLSFKTYDGAAKTWAAGKKIKLVNGSAVYSNLNTLKPKDRVHAIEGADGNHLITIIPGVQKKYYAYLPASNSVQFVAYVGSSEQRVYPLAAGAYIHYGDTTITPGSLQKDDMVMTYIDDGRIVEMEKIN